MTDASKPLKGIRVLDFGAFVAGPYAGTFLALLGAEVIKVEPPRGGDAFRRGQGTADPFFAQMNAGKKSVAVDLKTPEGVALIKALLPKFDVLIENGRPGVMDRLGLGADVVREINPDLIYSSSSGFGDGGPWRDRAAFDTIGLSMSGFLSIMSNEGEPQLAGTCIGDLATALVAVIGIVSALLGRERGGDGCEVKTSLLEAMTTITIDAMTQTFQTGKNPHRESRHPSAQSFALRCSDGRAIAVHMSGSQKFWEAFTTAMGREDLRTDPRFETYDARKAHYFELRARSSRQNSPGRTASPGSIACARRMCLMRRLSPAWNCPSIRKCSGSTCTNPLVPTARALVKAPWRFDDVRTGKPTGAPELGSHTREVGVSKCLPAEDVDRLIAAGVLKQAD